MPPKTRATTLQQQFGFLDADLKTPAHDAIMMWLDREVERLAAEFLAPCFTLSDKLISTIEAGAKRDYGRHDRLSSIYGTTRPPWPGLQGTPTPGHFDGIKSKTWEYPICKDRIKRDYVVGFVDMLVIARYTEPCWSQSGSTYDAPYQWDLARTEARLLYEVKPAITSVGETIRQIRLYQTYDQGEYFIVSPDARFASVLEGQGIHFVPVPTDVG